MNVCVRGGSNDKVVNKGAGQSRQQSFVVVEVCPLVEEVNGGEMKFRGGLGGDRFACTSSTAPC